MNFNEALDYINESKIFGSKLGLSSIRNLMHELSAPQKNLKFVHVAGTNGKGSTAALIASILTRAGYRTGLYISPYIQEFGERIQIDGQYISGEDVAEITTKLAETVGKIVENGWPRPTVFELYTALALVYFAQKNCDIVVLEVGLGGRLDATNVIDCPEVAVITDIGFDHTEILGNTIKKIAAEKGGIIKTDCDVVLCQQSEEVISTISEICTKNNARLHIAPNKNAKITNISLSGTDFIYCEQKYHLSLIGKHQVRNAINAIKAAEILTSKGFNIDIENIKNAFANIKWIGRLEILNQSPLVLVDSAHNPHGVTTLVENLQIFFKNKKIKFVLGILSDKDYESILNMILPIAQEIHTITPNNSRALSSERLENVIKQMSNIYTKSYKNIECALRYVTENAVNDDVICIFGSMYQVGRVRSFYLGSDLS